MNGGQRCGQVQPEVQETRIPRPFDVQDLVAFWNGAELAAAATAFQTVVDSLPRRKIARQRGDAAVLAALELVAINNSETAGVLRGVTRALRTNPLVKDAQHKGDAIVQRCVLHARYPRHGHLTVLEPKVKVSSTIDWLTTRVATDFINHATSANTLGYRAYLSAHPEDPFALYDHVSVIVPEFPYGASYEAFVVQGTTCIDSTDMVVAGGPVDAATHCESLAGAEGWQCAPCPAVVTPA
jgi:hypothetical protein